MSRGMVVVGCLLALWIVAPAGAAMRTVHPLAPGETLAAFDAAGSWQVALANTPDGGIRLLRSSDTGRTFSELHRWANDGTQVVPSNAAVGPDGTTWVSLLTMTPEIDRVAADGSVVPWRIYSDALMVSLPLVYGGEVWVAVERKRPSDGRVDVALERYAADGSLHSSTVVRTQPFANVVQLAVDHDGLLLFDDDEVVRADGSASAYHPDLGRPDLVLYHGELYSKATAEVWLPTAEQPRSDGRDQLIVPVTGGVAIFDRGLDPYGNAPLPVVMSDPAPRGNSPGLRADTRRMLTEANRLRAEQGLPPVVADAAISTAARNHARYTDRWHEGHDETRGRSGFTGADPSARCVAAGTTCGGEILYDGTPYEQAVRVWWATPFHRNVVGTPDSFVVGAASTKHTAVMDGGEGALVVAPIGLPRGTWTGPRTFPGELPDPGQPCGLHGPYGVAVTAHAFVDVATDTDYEPTSVRLADRHGRAVRGCAAENYFVPAKVLPRGTYHASATWTGDSGTIRRSWSFTATAKDAASGSRPGHGGPACVRITRARLSGHRIALRARSCRSGTAQVRVRASGRRHALGGGRARLRAHRTVRVTVRLHGRIPRGKLVIAVVLGRDRAVSHVHRP